MDSFAAFIEDGITNPDGIECKFKNK